MKKEGSVAIRRYRRQAHSENAFLAPLEVQTSDVVVARQRIRHKIAMRQSPGRILLPRVNDQAVTEFVGHVSERVVAATFSQINRDVGDESIL